MSLAKPLATSLLILSFGSAAAAAQDEGRADMDQINGCVETAIDAIEIPDSVKYWDIDDSGLKKYYEDDRHLIGVSGFVNYSPSERQPGTDIVDFIAKYYSEDSANYRDATAYMTITFNKEGTIKNPHDFMRPDGYFSVLADFGHDHMSDAPLPAEDVLISNAVNALALEFSTCMGFEPYSPRNGSAVTAPDFGAVMP